MNTAREIRNLWDEIGRIKRRVAVVASSEGGGGDAHAELMMAETFDGLTLGSIDGQGIYPRVGPFVSTISGTGTANVAVKAGADYMTRCASGAPWAGNLALWELTFNADSYLSSGILKFKIRTSDVTGNGQLRFFYNGDVYWIIIMGDSSFMRFKYTAAYANVTAIVNNTWYDVELHWNSSSQTVTFFINGAYVAYLQLGTTMRIPYLDKIEFWSASDSLNLDIDDLEIVNFGAHPSAI